jgi:ankyrin repeat protein
MTNKSARSSDRQDAVNSALNLAIERKNMEMITLAMNNGADAGRLLDAGIAQENMDMMLLALKKGANPNVLLFAGIARGLEVGEFLRNVWHKVAEDNAEDARTSLSWVETAVKYGADVNGTKKDDKGRPRAALHWAYDVFDDEITDLLLRKGAPIDTMSPDGDTVLMRAVKDSNAKQIEYYLGKGADPTCLCGEDRKTFPMQALENNQVFMNGKKAKLLALMMQHLPAPAPEPPAEPPPPPDETVPKMGTTRDIEAPRPFVLKPVKPEGPAKTFSL